MLSFVRCIIWRGRVFVRGADEYVYMLSYDMGDIPVLQRLTVSEMRNEYNQAMAQLFDGPPNEIA